MQFRIFYETGTKEVFQAPRFSTALRKAARMVKGTSAYRVEVIPEAKPRGKASAVAKDA